MTVSDTAVVFLTYTSTMNSEVIYLPPKARNVLADPTKFFWLSDFFVMDYRILGRHKSSEKFTTIVDYSRGLLSSLLIKLHGFFSI